MCGIFGIVQKEFDFDLNPCLEKASQVLMHRGPDDYGFLSYASDRGVSIDRSLDAFHSGTVGLLHRRLSIQDLSDHGWQPMTNHDRSLSLVFNGEIYNFHELRENLEAKGAEFQSHSDSEVLLKAYETWGAECVKRFVGMFAFAILDLRKQILFCARDCFGIKPFYYTVNSKRFAFASEPKALLECVPDVTRKANIARVYEYLKSGYHETIEQSFFEDVKVLPPAHFMSISLENPFEIHIEKYWSLDLKKQSSLSFDQASQALHDTFEESVKIHMRSDVEVSATLSGGIDSSSIVMMAQRFHKHQKPFKTISFIAEDERISEEKWINQVNDALQADPHKFKPSSEELFSDIDDVIRMQDEPFGSTSIYAQYRVFKLIHSLGLKVVLDGQGADEMLAGYRQYIFARIESLVQEKKYLQALQLALSAMSLPNAWQQLYKIIPTSLGIIKAKLGVHTKVNQTASKPWLKEEWFQQHGAIKARPQYGEGYSLKAKLLDTFQYSNLPQLLRFADRNSMTFSVESRLPFLTPQMAELIFSLPESYLIDQKATSKAVFRKAMRGVVPNSVLDRKDKIGFNSPEELWFKNNPEWIENILKSETAKKIPFLNQKEMIAEWQSCVQGDTRYDWRFWRWVNLIKWSEIYQIEYDQ